MRKQKITGAGQALVFTLAIVAAHAATPATHSVDDSRIAVTDVAGHVDVTMAGQAVAVRRDSTVLLPARIVTGHDGMLGITQAGTRITVSNDTDVEIPAEAVDGNLVARLVQHRGNVFYDVAPRDLGKLRVETPFLVAVIKGTQFNVTVQSDSTTISLFEGQLEILTPDGRDVIQLDAGEIAIRSLLDDAIRIVGMDDERVAAPEAAAASAVDAPTSPSVESSNGVAVVNRGVGVGATRAAESVAQKPTVTAELANVGLDARGVGATVDYGAGKVDLPIGVTLDIGAARADLAVGATADLGVADVDVGLGAASTVVGVDADLDADLDLGGGLDLGATLGLGGALEVGGALDLEVDLDLETPAETGSETTPPPVLDLGDLLRRP
jgi:hypothetical protein